MRLEALSSAHQLHQLRETLAQLQVELVSMKQGQGRERRGEARCRGQETPSPASSRHRGQQETPSPSSRQRSHQETPSPSSSRHRAQQESKEGSPSPRRHRTRNKGATHSHTKVCTQQCPSSEYNSHLVVLSGCGQGVQRGGCWRGPAGLLPPADLLQPRDRPGRGRGARLRQGHRQTQPRGC